MPTTATLAAHLRSLKRNTSPLVCPHCGERVLASQYEGHCLLRHDLNPDLRCVWCFGNYSWTSESDRAAHLATCHASFVHSSFPPPSQKSPTLDFWDRAPPCPEGTFMDGTGPVHKLHETPAWTWLPPSDEEQLSFDCPRIDMAARCVRHYLSSDRSTEWLHVMVKPAAYAAFLEALDVDAGKTRTLPFSCLCRGGGTPHRHFVLFSKVFAWKNIKCPKKSRNIRRDPIRSPAQLVRLLGLLGQRLTRCRFDFEDDSPAGEPDHYYVCTALPPVHRIVLSSLWEGGVDQLVRETYATSAHFQLLKGTARVREGLVYFLFRDLPGLLTEKSPFPVSKRFRRSREVTRFYVHLPEGKKLYFADCEEANDPDDFYDLLGECVYRPTPHQQLFVLGMKPVLDEMVSQRLTLDETLSKLNRSERTNDHLKKCNKTLKRKLGASKVALQSLQCRHIEYLERENDQLRAKNLKKFKAAMLDD